MTIIEREIERRERLIITKTEKEALVAEMQQEIARLNAEIESIDVDVLKAEINELAAYLPPPEVEAPADTFSM